MRLNVVLVIADCLRFDAFQAMNIKRYAKNVFTKVYSPAPSTFFAVPAILTGFFPFSIIDDARIHSEVSYLPLVAALNGYEVIFVTANVVTSSAFGYRFPRNVLFEDFLELKRDLADVRLLVKTPTRTRFSSLKTRLRENHPWLFKKARLVYQYWRWLAKTWQREQNTSFSHKIRAEKVNKVLLRFLENRRPDLPNFVFLHYMDTHAPYGAPFLSSQDLEKAESIAKKLYGVGRLSSSEIEVARDFYMSEVKYLDRELENLLQLVDDHLGLDKTLVVIVSDHGEAFGEEGCFTHPNAEGLIKEVLHVPLAFYGNQNVVTFPFREDELFSSYRVHGLIERVLTGSRFEGFGEEKVMAVSYRKLEGSSKYVPLEVVLIKDSDRVQIKRYSLNDEFAKELFQRKISLESRRYLGKRVNFKFQKLRNNMHRVK